MSVKSNHAVLPPQNDNSDASVELDDKDIMSSTEMRVTAGNIIINDFPEVEVNTFTERLHKVMCSFVYSW